MTDASVSTAGEEPRGLLGLIKDPIAWLKGVSQLLGTIAFLSALGWGLVKPKVEEYITSTVTANKFIGTLEFGDALRRITHLEDENKVLKSKLSAAESQASRDREALRVVVFQTVGAEGFIRLFPSAPFAGPATSINGGRIVLPELNPLD